MISKLLKLAIFLIPAVAFAGAGANGGSGSDAEQIDLDLIYGTFYLGGSSFNYLAANAPLLMDDQGSDLLTSVSLTSGLDPRVYAGIASLLASGSMPVSLTYPIASCPSSPCPTSFSYSGNVTVDDLAFSTGAGGQIADVTDPAQIIAEAEMLNLISDASVSTSTPEGSLPFTVTTTQGGMGQPLETTEYIFAINLEEVDYNGSPVATAVPEPSSLLVALGGLALVALNRRPKRTPL
jgi:PEP-CTERM motif